VTVVVLDGCGIDIEGIAGVHVQGTESCKGFLAQDALAGLSEEERV
jgi:hypothetical protein